MRLREWAGLVAFSVLLHVVIFWPLPAPSDGGGRVSPLIVSLPEVQSNVTPEVEPVFVEDIAAMPQTIMDVARDGDVVLCMGAGSIGAVPGKVAGQP